MEGAGALGLIAEVGIAIAGFAGVVATLRAPGGKMAPYSALRIALPLGQSEHRTSKLRFRRHVR